MNKESIILEPNEDGVYVYNPSGPKNQKPVVKQLFKSFRRILLAACVLTAMALLVLTFVKGSVWIGQKLYPGLSFISETALVCVVVLFVPLAAFKRTRAFAGLGIFAASYVFGLMLWVWSLILTYKLWGIFAVILGLFLAGIGIVPVALLAVLFNGQWGTLSELILLMIFVPMSRSFGLYLAAKAAQYRNSTAHF
jgi:hypothetical protein